MFAFDFPFWDAADLLIYGDDVLLEAANYSAEGYFIQNGYPVEGGYGSGKVTLHTSV